MDNQWTWDKGFYGIRVFLELSVSFTVLVDNWWTWDKDLYGIRVFLEVSVSFAVLLA